MKFEKNQVKAPERTYATFEEADAAAEAEKAEASRLNDLTRKGAFKSMASTNKHVTNDSFARVTWTDLAMGKGPSAKVEGDKSKSSQKPLSISQAVANFSLANQKKELME